MSAASNYLEEKILEHVLRVGTDSFTPASNLYLALFVDTAGGDVAGRIEAGTLTDEVSTSGTGYQRKAVTFDPASVGATTTISNAATVTFDEATSNWGTVTHIAVMDSATEGSGNVYFYGAVETAKTIETGDTFQVNADNLSISLT